MEWYKHRNNSKKKTQREEARKEIERPTDKCVSGSMNLNGLNTPHKKQHLSPEKINFVLLSRNPV